MNISGNRWIGVLVPALLAAQWALTHAAGGVEIVPPAPNPAAFPARIPGWTTLADIPVSADELAALGPDRVLNRVYQGDTGLQVSFFVAWFQSQRGGARQPHSPRVCLPGSGWEPEETGGIALPTASGTVDATRMLVSNGVNRSLFLYWYQSPRRTVASEWMAKFWLVADALRDRRTDTALVRIGVNAAHPGGAAASAEAVRFAQTAYPLLRKWLPHLE